MKKSLQEVYYPSVTKVIVILLTIFPMLTLYPLDIYFITYTYKFSPLNPFHLLAYGPTTQGSVNYQFVLHIYSLFRFVYSFV